MDQRVTELVAVVTPALTDITAVRQSGDARDRRMTLTQLLSLVPPAVALPQFPFNAKDFDNPNNANWDVNALAPAVADSVNNALTVRAFDDTIVEGIGGQFILPTATNVVLSFVGRAQTAPPAARAVRMSLRFRKIPDNALVAVPPFMTFNLVEFDIPTNAFFQFDSQTITFAALAWAAGEMIQFELVRVVTVVGTNLVGDYNLLRMNVSFT